MGFGLQLCYEDGRALEGMAFPSGTSIAAGQRTAVLVCLAGCGALRGLQEGPAGITARVGGCGVSQPET